MTSKARIFLWFVLGASPLAVACGAATPGDQGGGGGAAGGQTGSGATGGASPGATGGVPASGGRTVTGGAPATGGGPASGGAPATGGAGNGGATGATGTGGTSPDAGVDAGISMGTGGAAAGGAGGRGGAGTGAGGSGGSIVPGDGGAPPTGKITIWMAGDSTMQACGGTCPCGWGSQFQAYFNSNATVVNSAAGGRSIQTWLYDPNVTTTTLNGECVVNPKTYSSRWQAMLDGNTGMKAGDYLFIEFGINDSDDCSKGRHVGTALFQTYLGVMAKAAKDRGAQAIFLTSTSSMDCTGSMVNPNRGFGPVTKAAGTENDVPVIDLTKISADLYTSLGFCPNASSGFSGSTPVGLFFCDDHTHFEAAGAAKVAGAVAKALRDQSIPLAAYLK
ncbi:MAG: SGNH/GDSL hydrolase family protein [Pseudomonadota bacterium]